MNPIITILFSSFTFLSTSCKGSINDSIDLYNESNYIEVRKDTTGGYSIFYRLKTDSSFTMVKNFSDSLYLTTGFLYSKFYYNKNVGEGPYEVYSNGKILYKGFKNGGKNHGEYLQYQDSGKIDIRGQYKMGKKVGVWEDYYRTGILFKKVHFDVKGNFIKQEIFDPKTGELVRTEKIESHDY